MNDQSSAKQQIVEKIKNSTNILVTVNTSPTVDELTAALGLTMILNKLKKHATAVVSGNIPPAIEFLDPSKTFENTVDSLRDFIIALDKEKADHLRYKVDGDVVKIFITPYRTTITNEDLDFSQGDYNVELVLALNVKNRDNLDKALAAHGRILHDATVATISSSEESKLGSIDWRDDSVSSLSEMLVALSEALKGSKPILDEQIATAFLTGIVASTDRFSNDRTSSRVMTMAAQLMAAGANQQLIAAKLEAADEISHVQPAPQQDQSAQADASQMRGDGTTEMAENESTKLDHGSKSESSKPKKSANDGSLTIEHTEAELDPAAAAEARLTEQLNGTKSQLPAAKPTLSVADLQADIKNANQEIEAAADSPQPAGPAQAQPQPESQPQAQPDTPQPAADNKPVAKVTAPEGGMGDIWSPSTYEETPTPTFGGTLNATTEAAAESKRQEIAADRKKMILSHGGKGQYLKEEPAEPAQAEQPQQPAANNSINQIISQTAAPNPFEAAAEAAGLTGDSGIQAPTQFEPTPLDVPTENQGQPEPTLADLDTQHRGRPVDDPTDDPRAAVEAAFGSVPFNPANNPSESLGAQPFGEVPHDTAQMPAAPPMPPMPPMPDFSTLPPLPSDMAPQQPPAPQDKPAETLGDIFGTADANTDQQPQPPQPPQDPTQFRIPGQ